MKKKRFGLFTAFEMPVQDAYADNAASAVMKELDITAVVNPAGTNEADLVQSVTGKVFVAQSPEAFTYDDDGNMLSDGRFSYTWDGENRLASIETSDAAALAGAPRVKVVYTYDSRYRRIGKTVSHYEDDAWTLAESRSFLYDGWNMIREYQYSNIPSFHSSTNSYVWGLDLSGDLQGAGGVGGLLAVVQNGETYRPAFDGNGNVMEYISTDGTLVAHYEYSPFGETVVHAGPLADSFDFRFSTKYWEDEAKLFYYGYRYYSPELGRWPSRDPIGERGSINFYETCNNDTVTYWDYLGLSSVWTGEGPPPPPQYHHPIPYRGFQDHDLVKLAGVNLKCDQPLVGCAGHAGPHSSEYNAQIQQRLNEALRNLKVRTPEAARQALKDVIQGIVNDMKGGSLRPYNPPRKVEVGKCKCSSRAQLRCSSTGFMMAFMMCAYSVVMEMAPDTPSNPLYSPATCTDSETTYVSWFGFGRTMRIFDCKCPAGYDFSYGGLIRYSEWQECVPDGEECPKFECIRKDLMGGGKPVIASNSR